MLISYTLYSMVSLPVYVTPQFTFAEGSGKFTVRIGPKQTMGKMVNNSYSIPKFSFQFQTGGGL